jgi:hypothetical protein
VTPVKSGGIPTGSPSIETIETKMPSLALRRLQCSRPRLMSTAGRSVSPRMRHLDLGGISTPSGFLLTSGPRRRFTSTFRLMRPDVDGLRASSPFQLLPLI